MISKQLKANAPLPNKPTSTFQNSLWDLTLFWGSPHHLACKCLGTWTGASWNSKWNLFQTSPNHSLNWTKMQQTGTKKFLKTVSTPRQNANEDVSPTGGILPSKCSMILSKNLNRVMRHGFLLLKLYCLFYNHIFPLIYQLKFLL